MASSQNPQDRKDNDKSTQTSNISPGEPLWTTRDHIQQSFGQGYDWSDPVSLLKGNTTSEGGYSSGNAIDRFGTFSLREQRYDTTHGTIVEVIIDRKGGDVGEFEFYFAMDTEPIPGRPDPNTGLIGNYRTGVSYGFYTCDVDLDMYSLNQDVDGVSYDDVSKTLYVIFRNKETQKRLRFLVPYRTQVAGMLPIELAHEFSYKIDEYELLDVRNMSPQPEVKLIESGIDCQPGRVVPVTTTINNKASYKAYTLPLPQPFTEAQGTNPPEIDTYNGTLIHRLSSTNLTYTIGRTRSVEGAVLAIGDTSTATGDVTACLSGVRVATGDPNTEFNVYWSCVFNKLSGDKQDLILYDQIDDPDPADIPNWPNGLTPVSAVDYGVTKTGGMADAYAGRFTQYESHIFNVGVDPNIQDKFQLHENDPGGLSDFVSLPAPQDRVILDGDAATTHGNVKYTMFTGQAMDPASVPQTTWYMQREDASDVKSVRFPQWLGDTKVTSFSGELSAHSMAWNIGTSTSEEIGYSLVDRWVAHDNTATKRPGAGESGTSNILYNLSALVTDDSNYQLNQNNLRAYYMTCKDHQSKKIYLKFDSSLADPPMEIRNNTCVFTINKLPPYDVDRHAQYDSLAFSSRKIKHGEGTSLSYKAGQSWNDTLSGDNLIYRLFSPIVPLTQTTTPAFTGYSDFGAISADDILFLSFIEGTIPGDPSTIDPDPGAAGPELLVINPSDDDDASGVGVGNTYTTHVTYRNIGDTSMWMDFQYIGETRPGTVGSWVLSLSAGGTTATQLNTNTFKIDPDKQVTVQYATTLTAAQTAAGTDSYSHTYLLDYGAKDPGVTFPTTTIQITI